MKIETVRLLKKMGIYRININSQMYLIETKDPMRLWKPHILLGMRGIREQQTKHIEAKELKDGSVIEAHDKTEYKVPYVDDCPEIVVDKKEGDFEKWPVVQYGINFEEKEIFEENGISYINFFRGWNGLKYTDKTDIKNAMPIFDLIFSLSENNKEYFNWVMDWIADIFQNPNNKPGTALVFKSRQGTGKGTIFAELMERLIGDEYFDSSANALFDKNFNGKMFGKILINLNEGGWDKTKSCIGKVKHFITDKKYDYEKKHKDEFSTRNPARLVLTTNEDWVIKADEDDRRFFILNPQEYKGDFDLIHQLIEDDKIIGTLFSYFKNRKITNTLRKVPMTEAKEIQQGLSKGKTEEFLEIISNRNDDNIPVYQVGYGDLRENIWKDYVNSSVDFKYDWGASLGNVARAWNEENPYDKISPKTMGFKLRSFLSKGTRKDFRVEIIPNGNRTYLFIVGENNNDDRPTDKRTKETLEITDLGFDGRGSETDTIQYGKSNVEPTTSTAEKTDEGREGDELSIQQTPSLQNVKKTYTPMEIKETTDNTITYEELGDQHKILIPMKNDKEQVLKDDTDFPICDEHFMLNPCADVDMWGKGYTNEKTLEKINELGLANFLFESDDAPLKEQYEKIGSLGKDLFNKAVYSGGKSIHFGMTVKFSGKMGLREYKKIFHTMADTLEHQSGIKIDRANQNPARRCRLNSGLIYNKSLQNKPVKDLTEKLGLNTERCIEIDLKPLIEKLDNEEAYQRMIDENNRKLKQEMLGENSQDFTGRTDMVKYFNSFAPELLIPISSENHNRLCKMAGHIKTFINKHPDQEFEARMFFNNQLDISNREGIERLNLIKMIG